MQVSKMRSISPIIKYCTVIRYTGCYFCRNRIVNEDASFLSLHCYQWSINKGVAPRIDKIAVFYRKRWRLLNAALKQRKLAPAEDAHVA